MKDDELIRAYWFGFYDAYEEWKDAAEFEAKVAKFLSEPSAIERLLICWNWPEEKLRCAEDKDADCRRCRLKVARLLAEEDE